MILIYITCKSVAEAEKIGTHLMSKRLCPCFNVIPKIYASSFWPPKTAEVEKSEEAVLLVKTLEEKFDAIEKEVCKLHSYDVPCIFAIPVVQVSTKYFQWLQGELAENPEK